VGGSGWNSEREHSEIKRLNAKGYVIYLGYVNDSVLPLFYSGASALVFVSGYEGFGLPVLEAMQTAVPVITTRDTAMEEVTGSAALLCESDEWMDWLGYFIWFSLMAACGRGF
jgi:alpha-1,3-rhamnosyl/mannosyltransferase